MKVLLIKTSSMGDIIHCLPALTDAKKIIPNIKFDWVIEKDYSQIPTWHNATKNIFIAPIRQWRKNLFSTKVKIERNIFYKKLQKTYYDAIIDAQGLLKSVFFVTRFSNGIKHGYDFYSITEKLASFFYNQKHYIKKQQHAVERIRQLFAKSLKYKYKNTKGDFNIINFFSKLTNKTSKPYIIFLHSTTRKNKHWPENHWRELIFNIKKLNIKIKLPWSNTYEQQRAFRLAKDFNFVNILPKMTLIEIGQQIFNAKAIVSVDTGLSHLASALNIPNITIFGPTNPKLIGGYGEKQYSIKSYNKKMSAIKAIDVFKKLNNIL
ncbi:lipopolysaccharide heptosyltransferase RfaC [Candidatus Providencia siddallii]|uniref:Lipopolysaccharide heptosyltransferase 1 n=1 Tax=Candidatus Providencia siddallii TaxID=1715285 RepID=A0ABM9NND6_9GAMM